MKKKNISTRVCCAPLNYSSGGGGSRGGGGGVNNCR